MAGRIHNMIPDLFFALWIKGREWVKTVDHKQCMFALNETLENLTVKLSVENVTETGWPIVVL